MTPLRWFLLIAYIGVALTGGFYWREIGTFYEFFIGNSVRFLTALGSVLVAILTLKLGIALTAIFAALLIILKVLLGILITALLPGTIKAIALPIVFDFLSTLHRKSKNLQKLVSWLFDYSKARYQSVKDWWVAQNRIDQFLIASLVILAVPILGMVFFYQRFMLPFLVKKLGENFVQRGVKLFWVVIKRLPIVGRVLYSFRLVFVLAKRYVRRQNRRLTRLRLGMFKQAP